MTKVDLGAAADLSARRIASFENENDPPPNETVDRLADALSFPVEFLYSPSPPEPAEDSVSFRSFSRMSARDRDAALAMASLGMEVSRWITERFVLPHTDLPDLRELEPRPAAHALRTLWHLGLQPAPNLVHLLEAHGVRVLALTDDCSDLDAVSLWVEKVPFVFLGVQKSPERSRWDAAHELAHLVLHSGQRPRGPEQEQEADQFASEFLLPEESIRASAPRNPALPDVLYHKKQWSVSALAYIRRLHDIGLISDWHYRSLVIEASQAGYRSSEGDIERERSQVAAKVLAMIQQDGRSVRSVADEIHIPVEDLRGLLFYPMSLLDGSGGDGGRSPRPSLRVVR